MSFFKARLANTAGIQKKAYWWLGLAILLAAAFLTMFYVDLQITSDHALLFLDMLFDGEALQFYAVSEAAYFPPVYLIFAVWLLPVWLLCRLGLAVPHSAACLLWSKCLPLLAAFGCLWMFRKILRAIRSEDEEFWSFLLCSSLLFTLPVFATAQYDVIELFFGLLGFYMASREERLSWRTLLVLSLAVSLKLLMLFPIILLILLKEKRFSRIALDVLSLAAVSFVSTLPFFGTYSTGAGSFSEEMLDKLLAVTLPTGVGNVSVFCLLFLTICLTAYCQKAPEDPAAFFRTVSWLAAAHFFAFFLFVDSAHPFWAVLMAPFVILLLAQAPGRLKLNLLLETLLELCLILLQSHQFRWVCLTDSSFSYLLLRNVPSLHLYPEGPISSFAQVINGLGLDALLPAVTALLLLCAGGLLALNHPFDFRHFTDPGEADRLGIIKKTARIVRLTVLAGYLAVAAAVAFLL